VLKLLRKGIRRRAPRVPKGLRVYAIGDVHGRVDLLDQMFSRIDSDRSRHSGSKAIEIWLGDYIDRGPASKDVLDLLIARAATHRATLLKGNHDIYPGEFLRNPAILTEWAQFGGLETLMSYGLRPPVAATPQQQLEAADAFRTVFPPRHQKFLAELQPFFSCGDFYFVHAGVRPGQSLAGQREEDLLWIRDEFLQCEDDFEKIIVHGHTPVPEPEFRSNRINIDTGAYATGRLSCLVISDDRLFLI
jgi:serine/threonine protein phosphatase 1